MCDRTDETAECKTCPFAAAFGAVRCFREKAVSAANERKDILAVWVSGIVLRSPLLWLLSAAVSVTLLLLFAFSSGIVMDAVLWAGLVYGCVTLTPHARRAVSHFKLEPNDAEVKFVDTMLSNLSGCKEQSTGCKSVSNFIRSSLHSDSKVAKAKLMLVFVLALIILLLLSSQVTFFRFACSLVFVVHAYGPFMIYYSKLQKTSIYMDIQARVSGFVERFLTKIQSFKKKSA